MPPTDPVPAIGYIRVSMAREEMISPELQEKAIRDWADRNNRRIIRIISDLDKSGRNFKRRVQQAVQAVRDGDAREIVVWKFSRFGRQRLGWAVHLDLVESAGGDLISATEEVDAKTAAGRFTRGMLAEVAAFESDRASEQWIETLEWRQAHGLPKTGGPRWGYIRKGRLLIPGEASSYRADPDDPLGERYEPDPDLIEVYRSLYTRYVTGESSGPRLVAWLNHHGFTTVRGTVWSVQTLYAVLDSGFAAGLLREHTKGCDCKHPPRCRNVTYHQGAHKPIIDGELWQQYRKIRGERSWQAPRARTPRYPLSGLLHCGGCGWRMTTISGPNRRNSRPGFAYRCGRYRQVPECTGAYIRREVVEGLVLDRLAEWAAEIEQGAATDTPRVIAVVPQPRRDAERSAGEVARIDRALVRLRKMRAMDEDDDEQAEREYQEARAELLAERARHEQAIAAAQEEPKPVGRDDYGPTIGGLLEGWGVMTPGEKQMLLRAVIRVIRVHRTGGRTMPRVDIVPVWAPDGA